MAIEIAIKPNLSAFREATIDNIMEAIPLCDNLMAAEILEKFWVIPR